MFEYCERERDADRQTDRQIDRQTDRQVVGLKFPEREKNLGRERERP